MAIQTIPGGLWIPGYPSGVFQQPSLGSCGTIDAADEGVAFIIRAPKTGNIAKVLWATRTVTTGSTITVRGETLTETSLPSIPSGTLFHANFTGTSVVVDADDNKAILTTLAGNVPVTIGDKIGLVIKQPNTSFGNLQVASFSDSAQDYPYLLNNVAVSPAVTWSIVATSITSPVLGLEYDDGSYSFILGCSPFHDITSTAFNNSSTPDEIGLRFKLPFPARLAGFWVAMDQDGDWNVNLYDSNGSSKLVTIAYDKDTRSNAVPGAQFRRLTSAISLLANTYYRLVVEPSTATSLSLYDFTVNTAAVMDAFEGGQNFHLTSAKNPAAEGDWTNTLTRRPFMGLLIDGLDDGIGGGPRFGMAGAGPAFRGNV